MISLTISEVSEVLNASILDTEKAADAATQTFPSVSIDSRSLHPGQAFVALAGDNFDGHDFAQQALKAGASILIVSRLTVEPRDWPDRVFLQVDDTKAALHCLGHYIRRKWNGKVVAITGSMGKTTTRHFTSTILRERFRVHESAGNFNNLIGLPLSLCRVTDQHDVAVLELGMSQPGEIGLLGRISAPDHGVITNVAPVHLEFFSDVDEIAEAKGELLEALPPEGWLIFNADDIRVRELAQRYSGPSRSFGFHTSADVRVRDYRFQTLDQMDFRIEWNRHQLEGSVPFVGKHFLYNLAAAVSAASIMGVSAEEMNRAFPELVPPQMRGQVLKLSGIVVWDDSYNSSPKAVESVLETFTNLVGYKRKVVALGDMLELGPASAAMHLEVGRLAAESNADLLVAAGHYADTVCTGAESGGLSKEQLFAFAEAGEAADFLSEKLQEGDILLVKGSRGMQMERIVDRLRESAA